MDKVYVLCNVSAEWSCSRTGPREMCARFDVTAAAMERECDLSVAAPPPRPRHVLATRKRWQLAAQAEHCVTTPLLGASVYKSRYSQP